MHELALMEEVRRLADEQAAAQGALRIHALHLRIGSLSGVDPEALAFAFEVVMQGGGPGRNVASRSGPHRLLLRPV